MSKLKKWITNSYSFLIMLFFYIPIIYVMIFSFNSSKSLTNFTGFSLQWYENMFTDRTIMEAIYYTIVIAVLATIISTIVGTITAIGLSKSRKIIKEVVLQINDLPMMNPDVVTAIGFMLLFSSINIKTGFGTLLIAHIAFCIPYVILSVMPKLRTLDDNVAEAALDLGCTPWQALTKVIIPQIIPGIISGALIAFTMSFDDFVISLFTTGPGVNTIAIYVYSSIKRINPTINALSTIIVVLVTVILIAVNIVPIIREKNEKKAIEKGLEPKNNSKMTLIFAAAAIIIISGGLVFMKYQLNSTPQVLNVYNTGEYIGEDVISNFEEEYNCVVNYSLFSSNEEMYTTLMGGNSYDVIIPSDYMIEKMLDEDMLQPIDKSVITNIGNLSDDVQNLSFDPDNTYSIPYFYGSVGILYDTTVVDPEDVESEGWEVLKDTKYAGNLFMYDSERDSFMVAFKALGYSMNTEDEDEINAAYEWLVEQNLTMYPSYVTDEVIDAMINGEKGLAVVYSGDAAYICSENENMAYYEPEQGTNIWYDCMVIPENAENPELANEFINYILTYEASLDNSVTVGYTSPNAEVKEELSSEGGDYEGISAYTPRSGYEKDEVFHNNDFLKKKLSELWIKVKAAR